MVTFSPQQRATQQVGAPFLIAGFNRFDSPLARCFSGENGSRQMALTSGWHLERYEKDAAGASWTGDFPHFAQALEFATSVLGSGKDESIRFIAPHDATEAQIKQMLALGTVDLTSH
jgi:hypothetical protein